MITDGEIEGFLKTFYEDFGYDFRGYARDSIRRRLQSAFARQRWSSIEDMFRELNSDSTFLGQFISDLTVNVTEMFRDPEVYLTIRQQIVPLLRTYPSIKIWHAGCATGEEVYSMAILLYEEGLLGRTLLYGTDLSPRAIAHAKEGVYPAHQFCLRSDNYHLAGGKGSLTDYCLPQYGSVKLDESLKKNIVFAQHNLVADSVFSEVHMILCRNVLIYFTPDLQNKVLGLFYQSLVRKGFLCLGSKEALDFSETGGFFKAIYPRQKIYQLN